MIKGKKPTSSEVVNGSELVSPTRPQTCSGGRPSPSPESVKGQINGGYINEYPPPDGLQRDFCRHVSDILLLQHSLQTNGRNLKLLLPYGQLTELHTPLAEDARSPHLPLVVESDHFHCNPMMNECN